MDPALRREVGHAETMTPAPTGADSPWPSALLGAAATSRDIPNGTMVGDYRIEGKLGEGGMGAVYAAVHPMIGKQAAIKVIKPDVSQNAEAVERFVQEARAVNQIGHPNIVDVFAFGAMPDGRSFFAMEWLKGESLRERMARGRLQLDEIVHILDRMIRGLEAAHDKKIVHRDLKPDNVFLVEVKGERPLIKLLDFGIAKLGGNADTRLERTRTGAMMGTPMYIAPEQARGYMVDHRADIYSLGVLAFELFTGRLPFVADNAMDLIAQHLSSPPPVPSTVEPGLSAEIDALLLTMLDKEPARRPSLQHVREVLQNLRLRPLVVAAALTIPDASVPVAVAEVQRETRRGRVLLIGGLVAAAALAVIGVAVTRGSGRTSTPAAAPGPTPVPPGPPGAGVVAALVVDAGAAVPDEPVALDAGTTAAPTNPSALVIEIAGGEGTIEVDGTVWARSASSAHRELPAGPHKISVTARGKKPFTRTVTLDGKAMVVEVTLARVRGGDSGGGATGAGGGTATAAGGGSATGSGGTSATGGDGGGSGRGASAGTGAGSPDGDALVDPFKRKKKTP